TTLAYGWGLPLPYRIGEVWAHDVEARVKFDHDGRTVYPGDVIIKRGEVITEEQRNLVREETREFERSDLYGLPHKLQRILALFLIMSLMATLVVLHVVRYQPKLAQDTAQIVKVCAL